MIRLILFRFWPALLPLVIYFFWHRASVRRAKKENKPAPHFRDGPVYWTVLASLLIAVLCFVVMGVELEPQKGDYIPPVVKDGAIVPGHVQ
jgi:hypothetical protein